MRNSKVKRVTDNSSPEDLLKPFRPIKREDQGPQPAVISEKVHQKKDGQVRREEKRRDEAEVDVSLAVKPRGQQYGTSGTSNRPASDDDKSVAKSYSGASALEDLSASSLRRLRNLSERAVRKVKTFVSRPIKEATMRRFVSKVEARKQAEMSGQIAFREVKRGDDVFPKQRIRKSQEGGSSKQTTHPSVTVDMSVKSVVVAPSSRYGDLPSGNRRVYGNKNNNGKLMINDEPFWTLQKKPTEADLEESGTEDDIQLNAEIALEVYEGKAKLVNMPAIPIILDPMNELTELKRRDNLFYTKDVLFGNSVRSMINLCDSSTKVTPLPRRRGQPQITFKEPESSYDYQRDRAWEAIEVPFTPRAKDGVSRRSSRRKRRRRIFGSACEDGVNIAGAGISAVKSLKSRKRSRQLEEKPTQSGSDILQPREKEESAKTKSRQVPVARSPPRSIQIR